MTATTTTIFTITALLRLAMFGITLAVGLTYRDTLVIAASACGCVANAAGAFNNLTVAGLAGTPLVALLCLVMYDHAQDRGHRPPVAQAPSPTEEDW